MGDLRPGSDGQAIAALTIPYITLVNMPDAPHIDSVVATLTTTAGRLSGLPGVQKAAAE